MTLEAAFREDLLPVAATLSQEAEVCCAVTAEIAGQWTQETSKLVAFTYSSGIAQVLHAQRALLLEILDAEIAEKQQTASIQ